MFNRVTISALLKTVVAALGTAILIMLALNAFESWGRLNETRREFAASSAAGYLFTALHNLRIDRTTSRTDLASDKPPSGVEPILQAARTAEMPAL